MIRLLAFLIVVLPLSALAAQIETDLNGFRLQQHKKAVKATLGPASKTVDVGNSVADVHSLDAGSYMVFLYDKNRPDNIASIQITGKTRKAIPFKGLMIGDSAEKVNVALGKPARKVEIESPRVTRLEYDGANYTVEIDAKKKLYSIQLISTPEMMAKNSSSQAEWSEFKTAVLARDITGIVAMLRPDVEIYKGNKTLSIRKRFSDFVKMPDKEFTRALLGKNESVFQQLQKSEPERGFRMIAGVGIVEIYKFNDGELLKEIVFVPYNGIHRVYEISFRKASGRSRIPNPDPQ